MSKTDLQDTFLNSARISHAPVTVFLMNGVKMQGIVRGFDSFVVVFDVMGAQQIVYKHAISTLIPSAAVAFEQ